MYYWLTNGTEHENENDGVKEINIKKQMTKNTNITL